jgi:predicted CopG family antitoxin
MVFYVKAKMFHITPEVYEAIVKRKADEKYASSDAALRSVLGLPVRTRSRFRDKIKMRSGTRHILITHEVFEALNMRVTEKDFRSFDAALRPLFRVQ